MKSGKILLIGQAPGPQGEGYAPFQGPLGGSGKRLANLCGVEQETLKNYFELRNLLPRFPGKKGKGDAFPLREARLAAYKLDLSGRTVILIGHTVARAFDLKGVAPFTWVSHRNAVMAFIPHPSGINLWYNDPANYQKAQRFLKSVIPIRA